MKTRRKRRRKPASARRGGYSMYRSHTDEILARANKRAGAKRGESLGNLEMLRLLSSGARGTEELKEVLPELIFMCHEQLALKDGAHVLFPESREIVDMMLDSKFEVTEASFRTPWPRFCIAWQRELDLPGCFVQLVSYEMQDEGFLEYFRELYPSVDLTGDPPTLLDGPMLHVSLAKMDPFRTSTVMLPLNCLGSALDSPKALAETAEMLHPTADMDSLADNYRLLKAVCGLCVYLIAFPESLREGAPPDAPVRDLKRLGLNGSTGRTMHAQGTSRGATREHYRSAHFRELRSEKYKRDDNGNVRIVPVGGCIVGKSQAHTADDVLK